MAKQTFAGFTPELGRDIVDMLNEWRVSRSRENARHKTQIDETSPHRIFFKNASGQDIPPYACMQVNGVTNVGDQAVVQVIQPDDVCGEYLFNGPFSVDADKTGWAYAWGVVRMLGSASGYEACKRYAPVPYTWGITENPGPFLVYGADSFFPGVVLGRIVGDHCKARFIKIHFDPESSDTPSVLAYWDGPNPEDCGDITVEYPLGEPCAASDMIAFYDPNTDTYQACISPSAVAGETEEVETITDMAFYGCCLYYAKQKVKVVKSSQCAATGESGYDPEYSDITVAYTCPTMVTVPVVTSAAIVEDSYTCSGTCRYIYDAFLVVDEDNQPVLDANGLLQYEERWQLLEPCGGTDCSCPDAPTDTPERSTVRELSCVRNSPSASGLVFSWGYITTCGFESGGTFAIPIDECQV